MQILQHIEGHFHQKMNYVSLRSYSIPLGSRNNHSIKIFTNELTTYQMSPCSTFSDSNPRLPSLSLLFCPRPSRVVCLSLPARCLQYWVQKAWLQILQSWKGFRKSLKAHWRTVLTSKVTISLDLPECGQHSDHCGWLTSFSTTNS